MSVNQALWRHRIRKQLIFEHMVVRDAAKREKEHEC